jgi:hypothetical protein
MKEGTFYFSHDYNTRSDEKIKRLIRKHGMLGYGVFWAIIEDLYNNANALRTDYEGIAYELRLDAEVVKSVINDFELFVFEDSFFGSQSVERRIAERENKSKNARDSANYRWKNANALQSQSEGNAIKESKVNKGKEIKESKGDEIKESDPPPQFQNDFPIHVHQKKIDSRNCEPEKEKILSDQIYCEHNCMKNGLTEIQLKENFVAFINQNSAIHHFWENEQDLRKHFQHWLPKKLNLKNNGTLRPTAKPPSKGGFGKL